MRASHGLVPGTTGYGGAGPPAVDRGGQGSGREPGRLEHRHRPGRRARRRLLRRGGDGPGFAARGPAAQARQAGQARPARSQAGPGPQPVPVRGADRGHPGHPAVRRDRRGDPGRAPEVGPDQAQRGVRGGVCGVADRGDRGDLLLHPGLRRAGPQAAGPAAFRAGVADRRPDAGPHVGAGPPAGLGAVPVHQPDRAAARWRPAGQPGGDDRGGTARPGGQHPGAERRRAADRGRGVRRRETPAPRGAGARGPKWSSWPPA